MEDRENKKQVEFGRCIWEEYPIKIKFDYHLEEDEEGYTCPHVSKESTLRAVIVGTNEGGYNSTGICLECVLDYIREHLADSPTIAKAFYDKEYGIWYTRGEPIKENGLVINRKVDREI